MQKLVNLLTERGPFEPLILSRKAKWGQKFRSNYIGKYMLFQKKETLSQQQQNFTSSDEKHGDKKLFSKQKISKQKICPSREDKGISPSFETTDKRSTLDFSRRLPSSSSNGTNAEEDSKSTKVKSGATTQKVELEVFHAKGQFLSSLLLISKKGGGNRPVKFERSKLVHSLQTLQDGGFVLSEVCIAKRGLHVQNRSERCILQHSSTHNSQKIVRFLWTGSLYKLQCLCFSFNLS